MTKPFDSSGKTPARFESYGCNIGAYFSGIASGSLHGWCWLVAAFLGNILGTQLRPLFGPAVEREPTAGAKR